MTHIKPQIIEYAHTLKHEYQKSRYLMLADMVNDHVMLNQAQQVQLSYMLNEMLDRDKNGIPSRELMFSVAAWINTCASK